MNCRDCDRSTPVNALVIKTNDFAWSLVLGWAYWIAKAHPVHEMNVAWKYAEENRNRFVDIEGDVCGTRAFLYQPTVRRLEVFVLNRLRSSGAMLNHRCRFFYRIYRRISIDPTNEAIARHRALSKREPMTRREEMKKMLNSRVRRTAWWFSVELLELSITAEEVAQYLSKSYLSVRTTSKMSRPMY